MADCDYVYTFQPLRAWSYNIKISSFEVEGSSVVHSIAHQRWHKKVAIIYSLWIVCPTTIVLTYTIVSQAAGWALCKQEK